VKRTSKHYIVSLLLLCFALLMPALHTAQAATSGQTADGLHYFKDVERVTIYQYDGADTAITIPEKIDNVPVTSIEDWTFASGTLPAKVTRIGIGALSGCGSLAGITLPNNMNKIKSGTFAYCKNLASEPAGYGK
jgi:hypothetical protein